MDMDLDAPFKRKRSFGKKKGPARKRARTGSAKGRSFSPFGRVPLAATGAIVPARFFTKLKYVDRFVMSSTSGVIASQILRGNGPQDPDLTGIGHQPAGYDQLAALYNRYRVFGSHLRLRYAAIAAAGTNATQMFQVACNAATSSSVTETNVYEVIQLPYSRMDLVGNLNAGPHELDVGYISTAQVLGVSKQNVRNDTDFGADVSTTPVTDFQWFWRILTAPTDESTTASIVVWAEVTYYLQFEDRKPLVSS